MKRTAALLFGVAWLLATHATAQTPSAAATPSAAPDVLYADARAKERAVRTALDDPAASPVVLKAVRTVVSDYEALVRQNPRSEYSDDALWFAGWLSIDAFDKFGEERERTSALRLWKALESQYPASKLAKAVPQQLSRIEGRAEQARPLRPAEAPARVANPGPEVAPPVVTPVPTRTSLATLTDIQRTVLPDIVRVTMRLDTEVLFRDERLSNPARVFVDLPSTLASALLVDKTITFDKDTDLVRQVRVGRQPNNTVRVVLDVVGISSYSVYPLYNPYRLVIDCTRATRPSATSGRLTPAPPVRASAPPPMLRARNLVSPANRFIPTTLPSLPPMEDPPSPLDATQVASAENPPAAAAPAASNLTGGLSISRQLGLGVSRIVIDPGHGGHDPGATGKGITEASLVLDVGLRLEKLLTKTPGLDVFLTRRTDDFVSLQERTAIANREGADLFLSIHANASGNSQVHGVETYFLNFATTSAAAAVAARENAASGQPMAALPDFVKAIALHNKLDESKDFATYIQRAMLQKLMPANKDLKDLGVKQAPFLVLIGASMPSVLAEISFLTNAPEVKLLRSSAYRQRIAEALFDAVRRYQGSLKRDAKTAQD